MVTVKYDWKLTVTPNTRCHWAKRAKAVKADREAACLHTRWAMLGEHPSRPTRVTMTRIAPRQLDSDNLAGALKGVRDGIADALLPADRGNQRSRWADDSDGRVEWVYRQTYGGPKVHAVRIEIDPGPTERAADGPETAFEHKHERNLPDKSHGVLGAS